MSSVEALLSHPIIDGLILGPAIGALMGYFFSRGATTHVGNNIVTNITTINHGPGGTPSRNDVKPSGEDSVIFAILWIAMTILTAVMYLKYAAVAIDILQILAGITGAMCLTGAAFTAWKNRGGAIVECAWLLVPLAAAAGGFAAGGLARQHLPSVRPIALPRGVSELPRFLGEPLFGWAALQGLGLAVICSSLLLTALFASHYLVRANLSSVSSPWRLRWLNGTRTLSGSFGTVLLCMAIGLGWALISGWVDRYLSTGSF